MQEYFDMLEAEVGECYSIANKARAKRMDPEANVDIRLAKNMAERVEGLVSAAAPELAGTGFTARIIELEKQYGALDWRVALVIAAEVAQEKFCRFQDRRLAMEVGIRAGFAYQTGGIVAAPLEGFIELKIKKRKDGAEYVAPCYAGPIRGAGGTVAAFSLIITDYVRTVMGYSTYDPDEKETLRYRTEISDYHDRVTNLQYLPSEQEVLFLASRIPIEIDGDPTEVFEVSNYKDLPRIATNRIRGGVCLVLAEGLSQKAPKIWKRLSIWGKEFGLKWEFLSEFLTLQKQVKAKKRVDDTKKISPNFTFINDLVAGRPVLTHPMAYGGFRLRYGRNRTSGFSSASINPALMQLLNGYIATGTQLKLERPGKAASITPCDTIDGPTVLLKDGSVVNVQTVEQARQIAQKVDKILFLGDILISYGDFSENNHVLVPCGFNEDWWARELEKSTVETFGSLDMAKLASQAEIDEARLSLIAEQKARITAEEAIRLCKLGIPMHPAFTFYWTAITSVELQALMAWLSKATPTFSSDKLVLPHGAEKNVLEKIGLCHTCVGQEFVVISKDIAQALLFSIGNGERQPDPGKSALENINELSKARILDKAGTFIGARMGRPEKAKMRKMAGGPQVLFPLGEEGGRLRSFQSAMEQGKVSAELPIYYCPSCNRETVYQACESCGEKCRQRFFCQKCGIIETADCRMHGKAKSFRQQEIDIGHYFRSALAKLEMKTFPDLIKGVRGTSNKDHIPENLAKGILRAKHDLYVNKDGTIRFDMTEIPLTHFRPKEIGTSVMRLKELGYLTDIKGEPLEREDQVVEMKCQDMVLPAGSEALDEQSDLVLQRVCQFVDDLLVSHYGLKPFYNVESRQDLVGHLVIGLAPHISAGMVGRIIGFSATQGMYAHPLYHAAMRRDCFSHDTYVPLLKDGTWQMREIGEVVDEMNPQDIVDEFGTREIRTKDMFTLGNGRISKVLNFTKHTPQPMISIRTVSGKEIKTTYLHKHIANGKEKRAAELQIGDKLMLPYRISIPKNDIKEIDLIHELRNEDWAMVRGVNKRADIRRYAKERFTKREYDNYTARDSYPAEFISDLITNGKIGKEIARHFRLAAKRDHVTIPAIIDVDERFLKIVGLYIADGYCRKVNGRLYQTYIATGEEEINRFIKKSMSDIFGLKISEKKNDRCTYSSRVLYHLFANILCCGRTAYEKRIPFRFLNLPDNKIGYLLAGYMEGDGSVSEGDCRVCFDTVSKGLLKDLDFLFSQFGIFVKNYTYSGKPGKIVAEFYIRKNRDIPVFTITKGIVQSIFVEKFSQHIGFVSKRKNTILHKHFNKKGRIRQEHDANFVHDEITELRALEPEISYCLKTDDGHVAANSILTRQCDGDEACVIMLMDAFLNFSRQYLPDSRGAKTMDAPLVLTSKLNPSEVDDMAHGLDVPWSYPLELYKAAQQYKPAYEVKIEQIKHRLGTPKEYVGLGFTHDAGNINMGINCSAYKALPSMEEKLRGQMEIAERIAAVDANDVARLVLEKHLLKDTKGNLRKFSTQQFRCVKCNEKYRRPPLSGVCSKCGGKLLFTVTEGSVIKYLEPSISLAEKYNVPPYLQQTLQLLKMRIEGLFGKEREIQQGLGRWFG